MIEKFYYLNNSNLEKLDKKKQDKIKFLGD